MKQQKRKFTAENIYETFDVTDEVRLSWAPFAGGLRGYRLKRIDYGTQTDLEIYPIWKCGGAVRTVKSKVSKASQKALNEKNSRKKFVRLVNENFEDGDVWATFTYSKRKEPKTERDAHREIVNYLRRLRYYCRKNGLAEPRYVYVTAYDHDKNNRVRCHHHVFLSVRDRDLLEKLWENGGRTQTRYLVSDEYGLSGVAEYTARNPRGNKRFGTSANLKQPKIRRYDSKISKKRAADMSRDFSEAAATAEKLFPELTVLDAKATVSEWVSGVYINVRCINEIRRKEREERKSNNKHFRQGTSESSCGGNRQSGKRNARRSGLRKDKSAA